MEWTSLIHTGRGWGAQMRVRSYPWAGMDNVGAWGVTSSQYDISVPTVKCFFSFK